MRDEVELLKMLEQAYADAKDSTAKTKRNLDLFYEMEMDPVILEMGKALFDTGFRAGAILAASRTLQLVLNKPMDADGAQIIQLANEDSKRIQAQYN